MKNYGNKNYFDRQLVLFSGEDKNSFDQDPGYVFCKGSLTSCLPERFA